MALDHVKLERLPPSGTARSAPRSGAAEGEEGIFGDAFAHEQQTPNRLWASSSVTSEGE